ncbi:hypothetical protein B0H13DRAFT_2310618 [Mycena leptocephala]|nr:hypothetical protein B0H13DRAFT_2310618 [Mycena leptocephala]
MFAKGNSEHSSSRVVLGTIANKSERFENDAMRLAIVNYYNQDGAKVHLTRDSSRATQQGLNTEVLGLFVETYKYTLLDGRRVTSTAYSRRGASSSLIQVHWRREVYAGEIREIFRHAQPGIPGSKQTPMVFVAWMVASEDTPLDKDDFMWYEFPELAVETWIYKKYAAPNDPDSPPQVLPLSDIECQVARGKIRYTNPPLWITTSLDRFPISLSAYGLGNTTGDNE